MHVFLMALLLHGSSQLRSYIHYRLPDYISEFTSEVFTGRLYSNPPLYLVLKFFSYLRRLEI